MLCVMDYIAQQTVREPTALPRRNRLSKIGPLKKMKIFVAYYTLAGIRLPRTTSVFFIFDIFLVMGTNAINTARPSTPRRSKMPLRGERRDNPSSSIARQQQAIVVGGIAAAEAIRDRAVKQRDESNARNANANGTCKTALWGCTISNWRRDISELFRREPEAAARGTKIHDLVYMYHFVHVPGRCPEQSHGLQDSSLSATTNPSYSMSEGRRSPSVSVLARRMVI